MVDVAVQQQVAEPCLTGAISWQTSCVAGQKSSVGET